MNLLASLPRIVVCSWGRSGSTLLTHDIGQTIVASPVTKEALSVKDFQEPGPTPIHTHLLLDADFLSQHSVIISVRQDWIEALLSKILAQHYDYWQNIIAHNTQRQLEPFEFDCWQQLDQLCKGFETWHRFYQPHLAQNNCYVVEHQNLMLHRSNSAMYRQVYPDKAQLIKNYNQVYNFISQRCQCQAALAPFLQYKNSIDIVSLLHSAQ